MDKPWGGGGAALRGNRERQDLSPRLKLQIEFLAKVSGEMHKLLGE